jgi:hypothetical protein
VMALMSTIGLMTTTGWPRLLRQGGILQYLGKVCKTITNLVRLRRLVPPR